uniref:Protein kinase domain-containing protein n=1 Tax=Daphnia galeata TaxID=27404 RepID=A0A8J2RBQ6_9CRUS|nr:unnamed protein product [Daphnia galeata]
MGMTKSTRITTLNKKRFHHQALVEIRILDHLRRRDKDGLHNVIHMLDYFYFRSHLCISFELLSLNLYELIKKNNYQGFSLNLIRRFAYSLIQCLRLLRRENIIHCDLKPYLYYIAYNKRKYISVLCAATPTRSVGCPNVTELRPSEMIVYLYVAPQSLYDTPNEMIKVSTDAGPQNIFACAIISIIGAFETLSRRCQQPMALLILAAAARLLRSIEHQTLSHLRGGIRLQDIRTLNVYNSCGLGQARTLYNACVILVAQENVLLKHRGSSSIKVIDFGSSCYTHQRIYTYIQSRFYRSPEVILGLPYGPPIDMWSFGCILAELYTGYPIFPGENEIEQLACIMEVLDVPPDNVVGHASRKRLFFDHFGGQKSDLAKE